MNPLPKYGEDLLPRCQPICPNWRTGQCRVLEAKEMKKADARLKITGSWGPDYGKASVGDGDPCHPQVLLDYEELAAYRAVVARREFEIYQRDQA